MASLVFVYGTLKRGGYNHHLLGASRQVSPEATLGYARMHDIDAFPAVERVASPGETDYVEGEVYEVTDEVRARLDRLEGHPRMYRREMLQVQLWVAGEDAPHDVDCWVYIGSPALIARSRGTIEPGCWDVSR